MRIKGFKYSDAFTKIDEPDFMVGEGDVFVFSEVRYRKNMLIGVYGLHVGSYIESARSAFEAKYGGRLRLTAEMIETPIQYVEEFRMIQKYLQKIKPEIICHPHVPKPLHGVAPRVIMGKDWWDSIRESVYSSTDYHCAACGVHKSKAKKHQWLEAHEFWKIDYKTGVCEITDIVPLCHYCHNFIHSGRLLMIEGMDGGKSRSEIKDILQHGFDLLKGLGLEVFRFTYDYAFRLRVNQYGIKPYTIKETAEWDDFVLKWDGKEYKGLSHKEWLEKYSKI